MSSFMFLASDKVLKEIDNPNMEFLSINEAIERNVEIADFIVNDTKINRDEKIMMVCESEEGLGEMEIRRDMYYSSEYAKEYSKKQYFCELQLCYTEKRVQELIDYLTDQLESVDEIEIWSIWLDDYESASIRTINIKELTIADLAFLDISKGFDRPKCLVVAR